MEPAYSVNSSNKSYIKCSSQNNLPQRIAHQPGISNTGPHQVYNAYQSNASNQFSAPYQNNAPNQVYSPYSNNSCPQVYSPYQNNVSNQAFNSNMGNSSHPVINAYPNSVPPQN